ncbi:MAG: hypothetical protein ACRCV9_09190, partial [Burkholderiaceae bacterium]
MSLVTLTVGVDCGVGLVSAEKLQSADRLEFGVIYHPDGLIRRGGVIIATVASYVQGDQVAVVLNSTVSTVEFWLNGALQYTHSVRTTSMHRPIAIDQNVGGGSLDTQCLFDFDNAVAGITADPWDDQEVYDPIFLSASGFVTRSDDAAWPNRCFQPRLKGTAEIVNTMSLAIWGRQNSEPGLSSVTIDNKDGAYDYLIDEELSGRKVTAFLIPVNFDTGAPVADSSASWQT